MKRCTKCGLVKSLSDFYLRKDTKCGRHSHCKACQKAYRRSSKGKDARVRYAHSSRRKASNLKYERSKKGIQTRKRYLRTSKGREVRRGIEERRRGTIEGLQKVNCRNIVRNHVKNGQLSKPSVCEFCGNAGPLQAHHVDYENPHSIRWLCVSCHDKEHGRNIDFLELFNYSERN